MGIVVADITTSLDGFVAGPNDGPELPLGAGGERLHEWVYDLASWREPHGLDGGEINRDSKVLDEAFSSAGAIVVGKRMFDNARGWVTTRPSTGPCLSLLMRFGSRKARREERPLPSSLTESKARSVPRRTEGWEGHQRTTSDSQAG
jgi:hypothetical protein